MKEFSLILLLALFSCEKYESTTINEAKQTVVKDCDCDRVVYVNEFNLNNGTKFGSYSTINDCSGLQRDKEWTYNKPKIGECKN